MVSSPFFITNKSNSYYFFLICAMLYPLLFIFHCGDLTDTGFHLTNYHFFFDSLSEGRISKFTWFSDFLGALWIELLPAGGVLWIKVFYIINFALIVYFSHLVLKRVVPDVYKLGPFFLLGAVFSERFTNFTFCYDISSWLFSLVSVYYILIGIQSGQRFRFALAGFFILLAALSRIGNIVVLILLPLFFIFYNHYDLDKNIKVALNRSFVHFLAVLFGMFLGLIVLYLFLFLFSLNHVFFNSYFSYPNNLSSSHNLFALIKIYVQDFLGFSKFTIFTFFIFACFFLLHFLLPKLRKSFPFTFNLFLFLFIFFYFASCFLTNLTYQSKLKYFYPFLVVSFLSLSFLNRIKFPSYLLLFFIFSLAQIAGTNTGAFLKLNYSALLFLPVTVSISSFKHKLGPFNFNLLRRFYLLSLFSLFLFSLYSRIGFIYGVYETGPKVRLKMTKVINVEKMSYLFTTDPISKYIENVVFSLKRFSVESDQLFIYGHQPAFYYLSGMSPALEKYWLVNNVTSPTEVFSALNHNILKNGVKPLILDTKEIVFGESGQNMLHKFLVANEYSLVIDQPNFAIWVHQKSLTYRHF